MVDFFKYSGQPTEIPQYDFGRGFRALAQQRLNEARLAEDIRSSKANEAGVQARHTDSMNYNRESLDSTNDRYAVGLADEQRTKEYESRINAKKQQDTLLKTFNDYVARGDYSRADMMLGQLQSAGFKVDRQPGQNGNPIYRAEPPAFDGSVGNLDASGIRSQIGSGNNRPAQPVSDSGQPPVSANPQQSPPSDLFTEKNPFESLPGSTQATPQPEPAGDNFQAPAQPEANAIFRPTPGQSQEPTSTIPDGSTPGVEQEPKNPFDPYQMDTSRIKQQNQARLDPVLRGLIGATPGRYQPNMGAYVAGVREMGLPLEESLESMQKPMDTVAGLWKGEMGANAAMARASMSQGSQESNRDLRIIGMTRQFLNKVSQDYELPKAKQDSEAIGGIRERLKARNPQDDLALLHDIRNLNQNGVATQPDIDAIQQGNRTLWERGWNATIENFITSGMNESAREGLLQALDLIQRNRHERLQKGASQIMNSIYTADNGTEQMAGLQFMAAQIPRELWPEEVKQFFDQQGGLGKPEARADRGQRSSASVSVPANAPSTEPEDELDELMK
jgi:hypothetical protein